MTNITFMGTPQFAVPSLQKLDEHFNVNLVITRLDAVRKRGKEFEPSPIASVAKERNIKTIKTNTITQDALQVLEEACPDVICVAAFGCMLPEAVMNIAPTINVHASLLPRWRGAAPIQRAILAGDREAGVSIMQIVKEIDAGNYCLQACTPIAHKSEVELTEELAEMGADLLLKAVNQIVNNEIEWTKQDESLVTYAPKIKKAELKLDPYISAEENLLKIQASSNEAPARATIRAQKAVEFRVLKATQSKRILSPGEILLTKNAVYLGTIEESIQLEEVKPEGKQAMNARSWFNGLKQPYTWEAQQ